MSPIYFPTAGGQSIDLFEISKRLIYRGNTVYLITRKEKGYKRSEISNGINIIRLPYLSIPYISIISYLLCAFFYILFTSLNFDLIHMYGISPECSFLFPIFKIFLRKPLLLTFIGVDLKVIQENSTFRSLCKFNYLFIDRITLISKYLKKELVKMYSYLNYKSTVVYSGLDFNHFSSDDISCINGKMINSDKSLLLSVGRLSPIKGHSLLIKSIYCLKKRGLKFTLLIIGEGRDKMKLMKQVEDLKLTDRVIFIGSIPYNEIVKYFKAADVYIQSSFFEGLGRSLIEATYCGTAVVSTDCGGAKEILEEFGNGILVPIGDYKSLAKGISFLLENESTRGDYSKKAEKIRKVMRFNWENIVDVYIKIYRSM